MKKQKANTHFSISKDSFPWILMQEENSEQHDPSFVLSYIYVCMYVWTVGNPDMQRYHTPDKDQCAWKEKCFSVPRPAFNKKITMVLFVLRSMSKLLLKMYLVLLGAEDSPHTSKKKGPWSGGQCSAACGPPYSRGKLAQCSHEVRATNLYASEVSSFSKYNGTSVTLKISSHKLLETIILYFLSCF